MLECLTASRGHPSSTIMITAGLPVLAVVMTHLPSWLPHCPPPDCDRQPFARIGWKHGCPTPYAVDNHSQLGRQVLVSRPFPGPFGAPQSARSFSVSRLRWPGRRGLPVAIATTTQLGSVLGDITTCAGASSSTLMGRVTTRTRSPRRRLRWPR
jgi:hypothetical protein